MCVLTGAGISAESGVATFRGPEGLWSKLKPEELANFDAFMRNPELVWEWYNYRKNIVHDVKPNPAHYALVRFEELVKDFTLVTQNVDNLHFRAGSKQVLELHGNIERSYCIDCGKFVENVEVTRGEEGAAVFVLQWTDSSGCGVVWRNAAGRCVRSSSEGSKSV